MRRTNLLIATMAVSVVLIAGTVSAQHHEYVGADRCRMCHRVQHESWLETTHAKSTEVAKASSDPAFTPECLQCHATDANEELAGVQCEACHGPGSDYGKMSIMKDREASIANGLIIPSQEVCNHCHKDDGHSKAVVYADHLTNKAAIHEFKNPPGE